MQVLLIIAVVAAAGMVLFALGRGLFYFAKGHRAALDGTEEDNLKKQNEMMAARVKWQAITIILVILIMLLAAGASG